MNPRRSSKVAVALCGTFVLAGGFVASLAGFGSAGIEKAGAMLIEDRPAASPIADAKLADAPQATSMGNTAVANADAANVDVADIGRIGDGDNHRHKGSLG